MTRYFIGAFNLFIILFLSTGCFKRNESHVNVNCTDSCMTFNIHVSTGINSATPLGNTSVELGWKKPASPLGDPGRLIASGTTADDGSISFSFKAQAKELQGGEFYVTANKGEEYFPQEISFYGIYKYDSIVTARVHVPGKATIKIVYKNFNPSSSDDYFGCYPIYLTLGSAPIGTEFRRPDGQISNTSFLGTDASFTRLELTGKAAGDQYTYLIISKKKKNGARTELRDSLYIGKGETKTYEVEY